MSQLGQLGSEPGCWGLQKDTLEMMLICLPGPKSLPSPQEERHAAGNCGDSEFPKKGRNESWVPFGRVGYKQGFPCGQNVGENYPKSMSHVDLGEQVNSVT